MNQKLKFYLDRGFNVTPESELLQLHTWVDDNTVLDILGFAPKGEGEALVLQYFDLDRRTPLTYTDKGNTKKEYKRLRMKYTPNGGVDPKTNKKLPKYLSPLGSGCHFYFSKLLNWEEIAADRDINIVFTEGEIKADYLCSQGIACIGLSGVGTFKRKCNTEEFLALEGMKTEGKVFPGVNQATEAFHKEADRLKNLASSSASDNEEDTDDVFNEFFEVAVHKSKAKKEDAQVVGSSNIIPDFFTINWFARDVIICFDSDIRKNTAVQQAAKALAIELTKLKANPKLSILPTPHYLYDKAQKFGIDDYGLEYSLTKEELKTYFHYTLDHPALKVDNNEVFSRRKKLEYMTLNLDLSDPIQHFFMVQHLLKKELLAYRSGVGYYRYLHNYWQRLNEDEVLGLILGYVYRSGTSIISSSHTALENKIRTDSSIYVKEENWNNGSDKYVYFKNGRYDPISNTFLEFHDYYDYNTQKPYETSFDPRANKTPEKFISFLEFACHGKADMINYIRAWYRWALSPKPRDCKFRIEKFLNFIGSQGTGKSTVLEVLQYMVGKDNYASISIDTFSKPENMILMLDKKISIGIDMSGQLNKVEVENMNRVVSNEPITTRHLFNNPITTRLNTVVLIAGNDNITVPSRGSEGMHRRQVVFPFNRKPDRVDTRLINKLSSPESLDALFSWVFNMSDAEMYYALNDKQLPSAIDEAVRDNYEASNPLICFWEETFNDTTTQTLSSKTLYETYANWCKDSGHKGQLANRAFMKSAKKMNLISELMNEDNKQKRINGYAVFNIHKANDITATHDLRLVSGNEFDDTAATEPTIIKSPHDKPAFLVREGLIGNHEDVLPNLLVKDIVDQTIDQYELPTVLSGDSASSDRSVDASLPSNIPSPSKGDEVETVVQLSLDFSQPPEPNKEQGKTEVVSDTIKMVREALGSSTKSLEENLKLLTDTFGHPTRSLEENLNRLKERKSRKNKT